MSTKNIIWALADSNRQKILNLLKKKDLSVSELLSHFSISGASLSYHLNILYTVGLISRRRQGKNIIYSLNLSVLEEIISQLTKIFTKY